MASLPNEANQPSGYVPLPIPTNGRVELVDIDFLRQSNDLRLGEGVAMAAGGRVFAFLRRLEDYATDDPDDESYRLTRMRVDKARYYLREIGLILSTAHPIREGGPSIEEMTAI